MRNGILTFLILIITALNACAQIGVMKMVGNNTRNYSMGFGAYIKSGIPLNDASDLTLELGADIFLLNDGSSSVDGTIMCPLKAGYRYTLNGSGSGFYVEPQIGFNLVGVTSMTDANGNTLNFNYHGVVFAAGVGYLFDLWKAPFDLNLHYETVIAHGGSNNLISLGIARFISFGKRNNGYND